MFKYILFIILFGFIEILGDNDFYTISICSDKNYESSLYCKDNIIKETELDIIITKTKDTALYRTNYGKFATVKEAYLQMKRLSRSTKQFGAFIVYIDTNSTEFELFEVHKKRDNINKSNSYSDNSVTDLENKSSQNFIENSNQSKKIAYLTFDDGPISATKNIIKISEKENIPITLFFIGYQIKNNPNIYEEALNSNNTTVANHTYSHASGRFQRFYSNSDGVLADIDKNQSLLDEYIDNSLKPLRFAGRNVFRLEDIKTNDVALSKNQTQNELLSYDKVHNSGYSIYGWDVEWEFDENGKPIQTPEQVLQYMETSYKKNRTKKKNKVILLTHDIMFSNHYDGKTNLKKLIKLLKDNGWSFEGINSY